MSNYLNPTTGKFRKKYPETLAEARKWPWDCKDIRTWKYKDFETIQIDGQTKIIWHENPKFAYRHLDKD